MKPAPFDYVRPALLEEALAALGQEEAVALAGGQSLIPLLNLRLVRPRLLVDLARVAGLDGVGLEDGEVRLGPMVRLARLEADSAPAPLPFLPQVVRLVAHREIRNRSTVGGSLCHLDPAAELPALACLLEATLGVESASGGRRRLCFEEFAAGAFVPALGPGELVTEIRLPRPPAGARFAVEEVVRRPGDFAIAGGMTLSWREDEGYARSRVVVFGCSPVPARARALERAVAEGADPLRELDLLDEALEPASDRNATAAQRRRLARVAVRRCLERSLGTRAA